MRDQVKFLEEKIGKGDDLSSSERKIARAILNLFVDGSFSYLAVDHANVEDEDEFSLRCLSEWRLKADGEWENIVTKVASSRKVEEVVIEDDEEEEGEGSSEGDKSPPKMVDSDDE
jgi:hypothetical protein